jgi:hypothetical protein
MKTATLRLDKRSHGMAVRSISVVMYTRGTGSGHIARINAVFRGFQRANIPLSFYASAYRTKYWSLLNPGIRRLPAGQMVNRCDIFICDWSADDFVLSLPQRHAALWIGLKRLGTIPNQFPQHFHVIGMEPQVAADVVIWPIVGTWKDELLSRDGVRHLLNITDGKPVYIKCENGAYAKHIDPVFSYPMPDGGHIFRSSNSPFADRDTDLSYYPISQLFAGVDGLVLGGGYNSVHEALCHANLETTTFVNVGGDDQARRLRLLKGWEHGRDSHADELALHLYERMQAHL